MDETAIKTLIIMLVVSGWASYGYGQGTARGVEQDAGVLPASVGEQGSDAGKSGEKQKEVARDPFWPVGFSPDAGPETTVDPVGGDPDNHEVDMSDLSDEEQDVIKSHVRVEGILVKKGECIAIINSQLVKQGDDLSVLTSKKRYQFRIRNLTPDRIVLESVNNEVREEVNNP